jgi:hypothetical protein
MAAANENQVPITPGHQSGAGSTFLHRPSAQENFRDLDDNELQVLVTLALNTLRDRGVHLPPILPSAPKTPDIFDNARFEQIACAGLQEKYDGRPDSLIPTLNAIHIRRQNEVWYSATFVMQDGLQLDIVRNFSKLRLETVLNQAKLLWDASNAVTERHVRGTQIYNSRLLALFLMNSLTPEFATLLHSRIDLDYSTDGPLLLFTMCNHIHRNHLAFVESIKNKIRLATLGEFKNNVQEFLRFLQDNLRLITSTGEDTTAHTDLVPHILLQLRTTTIPVFQQSVLTWQREYMENKLKLSPSSLVTLADQECQVLKHANQWVETIDPSVAAMQALLQTNKEGSAQIFKTLAANFTELAKKQQDIDKDIRHQHDEGFRHHGFNPNNNPDWLFTPPQDITQTRHFNGRTWYFCTKCGRNGRWVVTHSDDTHRGPTNTYRLGGRSPLSNRHQDNHNDYSRYTNADHRRYDRNNIDSYQRRQRDASRDRSRSRSPHGSRSSSPDVTRSRAVTFRPPTPRSPRAQLSLLDSINTFLNGT